MNRTKQARRKSPSRMVMYVTSMSDTVSLMNSCKAEHRKRAWSGSNLAHFSQLTAVTHRLPHPPESSPWPAGSWWQRDGAEKGHQALENAYFWVPALQVTDHIAFGIISEPLKADNDINLAALLGSLVIMHANCLAHWQCPVYGSYQHECTERGSEGSLLAFSISSEM